MISHYRSSPKGGDNYSAPDYVTGSYYGYDGLDFDAADEFVNVISLVNYEINFVRKKYYDAKLYEAMAMSVLIRATCGMRSDKGGQWSIMKWTQGMKRTL